MDNPMKRLFATAVALFLSFSALAQQLPAPTVAAKSWMLLDATSGQVLAAHDPDARVEPASLVKIMTAYIAFNAVKEKRMDLQQMVQVSEAAWKVDKDSSKMFIEPRIPVSINDLLHGLIIQSGNDAAVALAEAVAGTEASFVALMNREAERMGLKSTRFANAHGLPHPENYTTARDLSVLAQHMINDHPELYKIYSVKSFTYNKITQSNRNRLLWSDPTVDGLKTGYTRSAGYCLISTAKRPNGNHDRRLISVVLGADSDRVRAQESQKLLNWGYLNFDTVRLYAKGEAVATPDVWKGTQNQVKLGFAEDIFVTVPKGTADKLKPVLERKDPLVAPIAANSRVGTLKVMADGRVMAEVPVLALEQVSEAGMFGRAWDAVRLWLQ
jgi:D-alanyl-D-alanine carboxypeptidase (penicillin-binding protein 5/6)